MVVAMNCVCSWICLVCHGRVPQTWSDKIGCKVVYRRLRLVMCKEIAFIVLLSAQ